ncbi:MAG: hypothetical protein J0G32_07185 [Alphaproteobacteria bacterium]|nr:hypothetical protein [Alphaproteobacteria bacterium]OJV13598.1 MAG: hypothetical protein BGO27_03175 [Alphaproteobacteria bacterium 33-17]
MSLFSHENLLKSVFTDTNLEELKKSTWNDFFQKIIEIPLTPEEIEQHKAAKKRERDNKSAKPAPFKIKFETTLDSDDEDDLEPTNKQISLLKYIESLDNFRLISKTCGVSLFNQKDNKGSSLLDLLEKSKVQYSEHIGFIKTEHYTIYQKWGFEKFVKSHEFKKKFLDEIKFRSWEDIFKLLIPSNIPIPEYEGKSFGDIIINEDFFQIMVESYPNFTQQKDYNADSLLQHLSKTVQKNNNANIQILKLVFKHIYKSHKTKFFNAFINHNIELEPILKLMGFSNLSPKDLIKLKFKNALDASDYGKARDILNENDDNAKSILSEHLIFKLLKNLPNVYEVYENTSMRNKFSEYMEMINDFLLLTESPDIFIVYLCELYQNSISSKSITYNNIFFELFEKLSDEIPAELHKSKKYFYTHFISLFNMICNIQPVKCKQHANLLMEFLNIKISESLKTKDDHLKNDEYKADLILNIASYNLDLTNFETFELFRSSIVGTDKSNSLGYFIFTEQIKRLELLDFTDKLQFFKQDREALEIIKYHRPFEKPKKITWQEELKKPNSNRFTYLSNFGH